MVRSIGADYVIDYTQDDFTKGDQPYDLMLDNVGNRSLSACRRVLTRKGTYVAVGAPHKGRLLGPIKRLLKMMVYKRFVSQSMVFFIARFNKEDLEVLRGLLEDGAITPVIDRTYELSETAEALHYLGEGHARGKVVITV